MKIEVKHGILFGMVKGESKYACVELDEKPKELRKWADYINQCANYIENDRAIDISELKTRLQTAHKSLFESGTWAEIEAYWNGIALEAANYFQENHGL